MPALPWKSNLLGHFGDKVKRRKLLLIEHTLNVDNKMTAQPVSEHEDFKIAVLFFPNIT